MSHQLKSQAASPVVGEAEPNRLEAWVETPSMAGKTLRTMSLKVSARLLVMQ